MSKPSREQLMAESQAALKEAIKVLDLKNKATYDMLHTAHDHLNRTGDAIANEKGVSVHLSLVKNYKNALKIRMQSIQRQRDAKQASV